MEPTDKISEHFTYGEVIKSNIAQKMQMNNDLPIELIPKVKLLTEKILEPVRNKFKRPVQITSWWRCAALNQLISNNPNSQHTKAEAVDFIVRGISNLEVAEYIRDNLDFDQLILERSWIHCSYVPGGRKEILRSYDGAHYQKGLIRD